MLGDTGSLLASLDQGRGWVSCGYLPCEHQMKEWAPFEVTL